MSKRSSTSFYKLTNGRLERVVKIAHLGIFICGFSCRTASNNEVVSAAPAAAAVCAQRPGPTWIGPRLSHFNSLNVRIESNVLLLGAGSRLGTCHPQRAQQQNPRASFA